MPEALRVAVYWTAMVLVASHLGLALAAAGIPCITALVGLRAVKRLKIFTDKFGQQAGTFALFGGLWAFLVLVGALVAGRFLAPDGLRPYFDFPLPLLAVVAPLGIGAAAFLAYRGMWHRLKANKALHALMGLSVTFLFWLTLYAGLAVLRALAVNTPAADWGSLLAPPASAPFWRILVLGLGLSLFMAGAFTGAFLAWRRDKDDFGRDYYNFTMRLTARVGLASGLVTLAVLGWLVVSLMPSVGELSPRLTTAVGIYGTGMLVALGCCGFVAGQENALRHKVLLVLGFLGAVAALTGLLAGLANVVWPVF